MINMEQENKQSETPVIKKSKGPVICSALCIILALAGIGFGVYGMFFNKADAPAGDKPSAVIKVAPTKEEVAKLLDDKYGLGEFSLTACGGESTLEAGLYMKDGAFDSLLKVSFLLRKDYLNFDDLEFNDCNGMCDYENISYSELNEKAHKYFGNDYDLAKEGYGRPYIMGIEDVEYVAETDSFKVKYITGIGCAGTPEGYYTNVIDVKGTEKGFTALISAFKVDATKAESNGFYITGCGQSDYNYCPNIDMDTIKTEQKAYDLEFIEEDGGYKLINATKR